MKKIPKNMSLESIIWKEGNYYVGQCLNIDVSSFGETKQEALDNLREAVTLYLEDDGSENYQIVEKPELFTLNI